MWWNFIGRTSDDVVAAREAWEAEGADRFGVVEGYEGPVSRIPAPALPGVRLKPRGNRGNRDSAGSAGSAGFSGGAEAPALS